jgi:hypothetical protein
MSLNNIDFKFIEKLANELIDEETRKYSTDVEWYSFPQTWSDTSCGYGGVAGQMITGSQTVVLIYPTRSAVVFAGKPYFIKHPNELFYKHLSSFDMKTHKFKNRYEERD